jgi:hypothetical protein
LGYFAQKLLKNPILYRMNLLTHPITRLWAVIFCLVTPLSIFGQKVLKMDTPQKFSKAAYLPSATFMFQIEGDDRSNTVWHEEIIIGFDTDRQIIFFETWQIHVSQIVAVRLPRRRIGNVASATLLTFGASAVFFAGIDYLYGCQNCELATGVGLGSVAVGGLLRLLPKYKVFRIGKKNKLRLFDLTPKPVVTPV